MSDFKIRDENWRARLAGIFTAPFVKTIGLVLAEAEPGRILTRMPFDPSIAQQDAYVHGGALGAMADHTAGGAAYTLISDDKIVLTAEYKINFLAPALGEEIRAVGQVLKSGRALIIAESSLFAVNGDRETLIAKAMVTLAVTDKPN